MSRILDQLVKPPALQRGDKVAAVSLSWGGPEMFPEKYEHGKRQIEQAFGLTVVDMPHARKSADWLFRNPKARADDLMQAFSDPDIQAIFSTIGGSDSLRIIEHVDGKIIRANPKILLGYSDTTISHFLCLKNGISSFYGPSIMAGFAENGGLQGTLTRSIEQTLFGGNPPEKITETGQEGWVSEQLHWGEPSNLGQKRALNPPMPWNVLQGRGKVSGRLIGGCMDAMELIKGTHLWPETSAWDGTILFFETSEDVTNTEFIVFFLRWYAFTGILDKVRAVIFGRFGGDATGKTYPEYDAAIKEFFEIELERPELPVITRLPFGHTDPMVTLPYGALVELDCDAKTISFLEKCVAA